ncbi:6-hydroxymethylpterin diphosphokinase MptE-like protein [Algoriphagus sp. SE2]|uniref:6-hydroxymethylpterin diphosphokinase MptE-like protein n=1 Tax=Algoriphagus sp. SE2 TaxID=3141536 RepID=UPI0031CDAD43
MFNLLQKAISTLRREGISSAVNKTTNRFKAWKLAQSTDLTSQKVKWEKLKDKYKGERVFLIGNGPSLNKTPLYLLKDEYKMCFNRFHIMLERLNWQPDFFLTSDNLVLSDLVKEFDEIIPKTTYSFFPGIHFRGYNFISEIEKFDNAFWTIQKMGKGFSTDLPNIYPGGSVIYEGFQILKYLGFDEVYLLGVDMNYKVHTTAKMLEKKGIDIQSQDDDDPNHFDPRYFGKDKKYHQPEKFVIDNTIKDLEYLANSVTDDNFSIVNAGYDSKLSCFPKTDLLEVLKKSDEVVETLFSDLFERVAKEQDLSLKFENLPLVQLDSIEIDALSSFKIDSSKGIGEISKLIFKFIPLGPYKGHYYFIKRKDI